MAGNAMIGSLMVSLGIDTAVFETGLKQAENKVNGFTSAMGKAGAFMGAALVAGAAAAGAAMVSFSVNALAVADDVGDAAARIGITATEFQKLQIAAVAAGGTTEVMGTAMDKLNQNLGAAHQGSKAMSSVFAELGLNANSFATADQAFYAIAGAMEKIKDPAEKAKISMQLFGKAAGVDMLEVLGAGEAGLRGFGDAAENSGRVMSDNLVQRLSDAKLALDNTKTSLSQMATVFAGEAIVGIMDFSKELTPLFNEGKKVADQIIQFLEPSFRNLFAAVGEFASSPYMKLLIDNLGLMARIAGTTLVVGIRLGIDVLTGIIHAMTFVGNKIAEMVTKIKENLAFLTPVFNLVKRGVEAVTHAFWRMEDKVTGHSYVPDMVDEIERQFNRLPHVMTGVAAVETQKTADAFRALQQATESLMTPQERAVRDLSTTLAAFETDEAKRTLSELQRLDLRQRAWARYWDSVGGGKINLPAGADLSIPNSQRSQMEQQVAWIPPVVDEFGKQVAANDNLRKAFAGNMTDAFMEAIKSGDWGEAFGNKLREIVLNNLSNALNNVFSSIFDSMRGGTSSGGGIGGVISSIFGGFRANGGSVNAGTPYIVGERGRELFVPQSSGKIISNKDLNGGGGSVVLPIHLGSERIETIMVDIANRQATTIAAAGMKQMQTTQARRQSYGIR